MPPALRDQQHRRPRLGLKRLHYRAPIAGGAIETQEGNSDLLQHRLDEVEQGGPLREHQRFVPVCGRVDQGVGQSLHLRGRGRLLPRQKPGVAGRLAQAQEGLQGFHHVELRPVTAQGGYQIALSGGAYRLVEPTLALVQSHGQGGFAASRQLGRHLGLAPTQDEGADALAQRRGRSRQAVGYRPPRSLSNSRRPPKSPRLAKCMRLHSSSSRFSTGVPVIARRKWASRA